MAAICIKKFPNLNFHYIIIKIILLLKHVESLKFYAINNLNFYFAVKDKTSKNDVINTIPLISEWT